MSTPDPPKPKPWVARVWQNGKMYWQGRYEESWQASDALTALHGKLPVPPGAYVTLDYEPGVD